MEWIEGQDKDTSAAFENLSLREPPNMNRESKSLKESLEMLLEEATWCADLWTDVNMKYDDRRSFSSFLRLFQNSGLDWHRYISTELLDVYIQPPNRWSSIQAPWYPNLTCDSNWVMANMYYHRSLSLMELLQRIRSESANDFSREQAGLLASFLNHLIMIQQEQRAVACSFVEHLEQLRKSVADSALTNTSNAPDNGDKDRFSQHRIYKCMWDQKHIFDSLYIMSRESAWLVKKLEASRPSSASLVEECHRILENIVLFIEKFKKSKESMDQYLLDELYPFAEDKMTQLVVQNKEILHDFGKLIKDLQEQGVGKESVTETLLGCFIDVVDKTERYGHAERSDLLRGTCSSLQGAFSEASKETSELINETIQKLNSLKCSLLTSGGSPLGNITLWRILFESCVINLRLDLICTKHGETIKLRDELSESMVQLLTVGESVLVEFVAMHKTVAEITYMLGDAFTTGGAGMREVLSYEGPADSLNESLRENDKTWMEMDFDIDFPWDKHNVPDSIKLDLDDPNMELIHNVENYGAASEDEFTYI